MQSSTNQRSKVTSIIRVSGLLRHFSSPPTPTLTPGHRTALSFFPFFRLPQALKRTIIAFAQSSVAIVLSKQLTVFVSLPILFSAVHDIMNVRL